MAKIDLGRVVGPQGPQGPQGEQGVTGLQGPRGYPATVNGVSPDASGAIKLTAANIGTMTTAEITTALDGKAPAGFISETGSFTTADAEEEWLLGLINGMANDTVKVVRSYHNGNISPYGGGYYQYVITKASSGYAVIEMKHYGGASGATLGLRNQYGGALKPWEWVNPPMQLGVEYRTTERYLGKPVYAKTIYMGAMPNNAILEVSHGISNIGHIVHLSGTRYCGDNYAYIPQSNGHPAFDDYMGIGISTVWIVTTREVPNYVAYALIKYTKATD